MQAATVVINRRALRHNPANVFRELAPASKNGCGGESERLWSRSS